MKKIELKVNSKRVPLNPFVTLFFIRTVEAMAKSLRGGAKPRKIEIKIS
ncbi:MAG: hypothetical protein QME32_01085 [Endomicrobiia bacterium]|nr:hypothetical protein [Endomicrobiia bacterium]